VTNSTSTKLTYNYHETTASILRELRRERDRQIIARRFGFGLKKRQTLEKIGSDFDITRERVRQIEKAAIAKMRTSDSAELSRANEFLSEAVRELGNIALIEEVAGALDISPVDEAYAVFLALLAPGVKLIEESDHLRASVGLHPIYGRDQVIALIDELLATITEYGKPISLTKLHTKLPSEVDPATLEQLLRVSKQAAYFDGKWGARFLA
jgi:hypothetical protein